VQQLLCRSVDMGGLAVVDRDLGALLVLDVLAVLAGARLAVRSLLHLARKRVRHLGLGFRFRLVVPDLLLVLARDLGHDEVHLLGDQLALLPSDWLTSLSSCPHLFSILISLPVGDTVLFCDILALRNHLEMRNCLGSLFASLLYKQLGRQLCLVELLWNHSHGTLSVRNNLTSGLHHLRTNILLSVLAFLDKHRVTLLIVSLDPLDGLVGGHVHTKLLVM